MRLHVRFQLDQETAIPIDHNHALLGLVYRLLSISDKEYSATLHDDGYSAPDAEERKCKLFTFSGLRAPADRRRIRDGRLFLKPGYLDWYLSSPRSEFLLHSVTGLIASGDSIQVDRAELRIHSVESLPVPTIEDGMEFVCISPIVGTWAGSDGRTEYLRPGDDRFSEALRLNLQWKHRLLYGVPEPEDRFEIEFDRNYLADPRRRGGTKLVTFKGINLVGAFAPFRLRGSETLIKTAWECGLGGKNSIGLGMIDCR